MAGVADLLIRMAMDSRGVTTGADQVDSKLNSVAKKGQAAFRALAAGGIAIAAKELFNLGVEAESWQRKFDTVFAEAGGTVAAWADDFNERFGQSEERLRGVVAGVGDLLVPMGFTRDVAAATSTKVLELAGALSEWKGGVISVEESTNILTKAVLGERDALIGLGVKISEEEVKAALLAKGMDGLTGSALAQAKAQVTLELVTAKSTDAITAFESGGSAALIAQNNLKAAMDDFRVTLGEAIVQLAPLVGGLAGLLSVLGDIDGVLPAVATGIAAIALGAPPLIAAVAAVAVFATAIDHLPAKLDALHKELETQAFYYWEQQIIGAGFEVDEWKAKIVAAGEAFLELPGSAATAGQGIEDGLIPAFTLTTADAQKWALALGDASSSTLAVVSVNNPKIVEEYRNIRRALQEARDKFKTSSQEIINIWQGAPEAMSTVDIQAVIQRALDTRAAQEQFQRDMETLAGAGFGTLVDFIADNPDKDEAVALMGFFADDMVAAADFSDEFGLGIDRTFAKAADQASADRWAGLGRSMAAGIVSGAGGLYEALIASLNGQLDDTLTSARGLIEAQSPSMLWHREVGVPIGEGIAEGILSTSDKVVEAVLKVVGGAIVTGQGLVGQFVASVIGAQSQGLAGMIGGDLTGQNIGDLFQELQGSGAATLTHLAQAAKRMGGIGVPGVDRDTLHALRQLGITDVGDIGRKLERIYGVSTLEQLGSLAQLTGDPALQAMQTLLQSASSVAGGFDELEGTLGIGNLSELKRLLGFAAGGIVPGPMGAPLPILAHGGETVIPVGRGGSGTTVVVNVAGSVVTERDLTASIYRSLRDMSNRGGSLGL